MSLNGRVERIESNIKPAADVAERSWERIAERWNAAGEELIATMAERHVDMIVADFADAPDPYDWLDDEAFLAGLSTISRELVQMLKFASGILSIGWAGPLALPAVVCDALLAVDDAELDAGAQCADCGYDNPYRVGAWKEVASHASTDRAGRPQYITGRSGRLTKNPRWRNPLIVLDSCAICGGEDMGWLRYWKKHRRWPERWEPRSIHCT